MIKAKAKKMNIFLLMMMFIIIFPVFEPNICTQYTLTTYLYSGLNIVLFFALIFYTVVKNRLQISKIFFFWAVYRLYLLFIMICCNNMGDILQWGYQTVMVLNIILIFEVGRIHNCFDELLFAMAILGAFLLIANFITLLVFPRGIIRSTDKWDNPDNDFYILGIKTMTTTMIFPSFASAYIYNYRKKSVISFLLLTVVIIASILNIIYKEISGAIIVMVILTGLLIARRIFNNINIKFKYFLLLAIIVTILVTFFNAQTIFSDLFINVFGKDASMSSRTEIWEGAKEILASENIERFLFGNGFTRSFIYYNGKLWPPHNQLLSLLYTSGIFGTIYVYFFLVYLSKGKDHTSFIYKFLVCMCFSECVLLITQVYLEVAVTFIPFIMFYYLPENRKPKNYPITYIIRKSISKNY